MHILFNGTPQTIDNGTTVAALLCAQGLGERRVAVEVNGQIVPRSLHDQQLLDDGDRIEVVHALGGG